MPSVDRDDEKEKEVDSGSITPRTVGNRSYSAAEWRHAESEQQKAANYEQLLRRKSLEFEETAEKIISIMQGVGVEVMDQPSIDRVSNGEFPKFVTGVNSNAAKLSTYAKLADAYMEFLKSMPALDLYCKVDYANLNNNSVSRFGINSNKLSPVQSRELVKMYDSIVMQDAGAASGKHGAASSSKKSKKNLDPQHMLHPLEVFNIKKAYDFCTSKLHKNILVDIFERNDGGSLQLDDANKTLKIHTIVLHIQNTPKGIKILVIDPSNSDFSKHLAHNSGIIFGYDNSPSIQTVQELQFKIYAVPEKAKIGPNPDEYRDCTDIAVKIAFGLNKLSDEESVIDITKLDKLKLIQEITNRKVVNNNWFSEKEQTPARIRQASEEEIREKAEKLLILFQKQKETADLYNNEVLVQKVQNSIGNNFNKAISCESYSDLLKDMSQDYAENVKLLAEIMQEAV